MSCTCFYLMSFSASFVLIINRIKIDFNKSVSCELYHLNIDSQFVFLEAKVLAGSKESTLKRIALCKLSTHICYMSKEP